MLNTPIPRFVTFMLHRLKSAGHQAYIVGGAVRNACLCRPVTDWDVATSAAPDKIKSVFQDIRHFALKKGTVTLVRKGRHYEITTFRGPNNLLKGDLARRDLTINAVAYDPEKDVFYDYFGGKKDLTRKIIRAVGDPEARFKEDPLRLVRAVRLANELDFTMDTATRVVMSRLAPLLGGMAPERIRDELIKILVCPRPSKGFRLMHKTGLLETVLPELLEGYLKRQNRHHRYTIFRHIMETIDTVTPDLVLRLTGLLHDIAKPRVRQKINGAWHFYGHEVAGADLAEEIMTRLRFSNDMIQKVSHLIRHHMIHYNQEWRDKAIRRLIWRVGQDRIKELLTFRRADIMAQGLHTNGLDLLNQLEKRVRKAIKKSPIPTNPHELAIDGHRVMEILELPQGPDVGNILNLLLEKVIEDPKRNTEEGLAEVLKHMK